MLRFVLPWTLTMTSATPNKLTVPLRELITLDRTGSTEFAVILIFCNTVRSKRVRTNCLR